MLARHEELDPEEFWERAADAVGDQAVITWSSTFALVEISAAGVTKATTLALLAEELGVGPAEWWRSATCPTTCRCWSGPARRTPWPTRTPRSSRPPTTSRRATTTTASPGAGLGVRARDGCCVLRAVRRRRRGARWSSPRPGRHGRRAGPRRLHLQGRRAPPAGQRADVIFSGTLTMRPGRPRRATGDDDLRRRPSPASTGRASTSTRVAGGPTRAACGLPA